MRWLAVPERSQPCARCSDQYWRTSSAPSSWFPFLDCFLSRLLERDERLVPESVEPAAKRFEASRVDGVHPSRALGSDHNEPSRPKDFQNVGTRRAAHIHPFGNLPHRASAVAQASEHAPTGRVS